MRAVAMLLLAAQLAAQPADPDPRALAFALLRARGELALADSAYARTRHLYERRMVSAAELEARHAERERAEITVLERWSAIVGAGSGLRVVRAFKARAADGGVVARLRIATSSHRALALLPVPALPDDLLERLPTAAPEAFLSVKDEPGLAGTAIGVPYEQPVSLGQVPTVHDVEFRLLRDVDAVVVSLTTGSRVDERKVWLEADATGVVSVRSLPFSQEADVGAEATYDLTIERMGTGDAPLRLSISGLPDAVARRFTDAESGARIGQLRFSAGEHARRVRLTLSLPDGDAGAMVVDSAYRFLVLAAPEHAAARDSSRGRSLEAWKIAGAGAAELELVPRGVGRAELRAFNLFHEAREGEQLVVEATVRNAGTRELDQVRLVPDLPPGWTAVADPPELRHLLPNAESVVRVAVTPAADAELGDYEARLRIDGTAGGRRVASEPTVLRVRIRGEGGGIATIVLLGVVAVGATGAVLLTRRLAKR